MRSSNDKASKRKCPHDCHQAYWPGVAFGLNLTFTSFNFYVLVLVLTSNFNFYTSLLYVLSNLTFTSSPPLTHFTFFWLTFYTSFGANFINPIWILRPTQMHARGEGSSLDPLVFERALAGRSKHSSFIRTSEGMPEHGECLSAGVQKMTFC